MTVIIDRLEGKTAAVELENGDVVNVPSALFENPREGAAYNITPCENPLKDDIKKLMDEVFDD